MRKWLRQIEPTPKLLAAIAGGLLALAALWVAEAYGLADVRSTASGVLVLALTSLGGWLKSDASSPGELLDAETDGSPGEHA